MVLEIVKFGHPVLRQKGAKIEKITPQIKQLIDNMLETMKDAHGVGLAAQQIGEALQLAVIDVRGVEDRPSTLELDGKPADVDAFMPLILINPEIKPVNAAVKGPEGCLSFPEIYADIERPESVDVTVMTEDGKTKTFRCGGLLSRAVQHENDHLNGVLFIDRMDRNVKQQLKPEIDDLQAATKKKLKK
ncbi:MAG TPA: peptide deformylase [Verrucomicrobiae bacterium]